MTIRLSRIRRGYRLQVGDICYAVCWPKQRRFWRQCWLPEWADRRGQYVSIGL